MSRTSAIAKTAALAMTATAFAIFPAAAQQMTREQYQAVCDRMPVSPEKIRCRAEQLRAESVAAQAGIRSEADLSSCISFLGARKAAGVVFDRPITRDNACAVARQLGMTNG